MQPLSKNAIADEIMREIAARPAVDWKTITPETARAGQIAHAMPWNEPTPAVATAETLTIPGPRGDLTVRTYRPIPADRITEPRAPIIFAHGGGWATGSIDTHDRPARLLALHASHPLISVD
ncbi:MAG: hypothetical protein RL291_294, partial [Pseudomonadota bacterium]